MHFLSKLNSVNQTITFNQSVLTFGGNLIRLTSLLHYFWPINPNNTLIIFPYHNYFPPDKYLNDAHFFIDWILDVLSNIQNKSL